MSKERIQCCKSIFYSGHFSSFLCSRSGKVQHEGKWYCTIHDPERVARKDAERQARWEAERLRQRALWDYQNKVKAFTSECINAVQAIADGHNDARSLCTELLKTKPVKPEETK